MIKKLINLKKYINSFFIKLKIETKNYNYIINKKININKYIV